MKVTVLLVTYNHERFVRQALDSILMQQVSFAFEVLISEDCSTDNTRAIVREYARNHPDKIRLLLSPHNLNDNTIIERGLAAARGEYIALLDGDDYWTSPLKLQKQVEVMDAQPDCVLCWHGVREVDEAGQLLRSPVSRLAASCDVEQLLACYDLHTCSAMLRRSALPDLPAWYKHCCAGDFPLFVLTLQNGKGVRLQDRFAAYRVHAEGVWSGAAPIQRTQWFIQLYSSVRPHLNGGALRIADRKLARYWGHLAMQFKARGEDGPSRATARTGLREYGCSAKLLLIAYLPSVIAPARALLRLLRRLDLRQANVRQYGDR